MSDEFWKIEDFFFNGLQKWVNKLSKDESVVPRDHVMYDDVMWHVTDWVSPRDLENTTVKQHWPISITLDWFVKVTIVVE